MNTNNVIIICGTILVILFTIIGAMVYTTEKIDKAIIPQFKEIVPIYKKECVQTCYTNLVTVEGNKSLECAEQCNI